MSGGRALAGGRPGGAPSGVSPASQTPYAWYDAELSQPNSVGYVSLTGAGGDTISATAPANTASYSAAPRGGGAATTGAASPGAFSFSTAGDWVSVSLLSAGAVELAKFDASASYGNGHTDTHGVAWLLGNPKLYDRSVNARAAFVNASGTNAATVLSWRGSPSVYQVEGTGGRIQAVANNNAWNVADLDVWFDLSMDWANITAATGMVTRVGADPDRQFLFRFSATGQLSLFWYPLGTNASLLSHVQTNSIAVDLGLLGSERIAVRATLDVDNGAGGYTQKFWYRIGGYDGTWTALATNTVGATTALPTVNRVLEWGHGGATAVGSAMRIFGGALRTSIDSATNVAFYDPAVAGQITVADSGGNSYNLARPTSGRKGVVQSPSTMSASSLLLLGADDKLDGPTAAIPPCDNASSASMFAVIRPHATQASPKVIFSTRSGTGAGVTLRMASATTIVADVSDGTTTNTTPAVTFTPSQRVVAGVHLDSGGTAYVSVNNTVGSTVARPSGTQAGGVLVVGANSTPADFLDAECRVPWYALDRLATVTEIAQLTAFYKGGT